MPDWDEPVADRFSPEGAEDRAQTRADLDRAAAELKERRAVAESVKTGDLDLAERIRALGFDGETAQVFDLLPLIHVAWADGKIQKQERASIFEILKLRKLGPSSPASRLMVSLLEEQPSQAYMDESIAVLKDLVRDRPKSTDAMVNMCVSVAEAAGGFLGLGDKIALAEAEAMARIVLRLGDQAEATFRARMGLQRTDGELG